MLLFLTANMAAVTSRANQQYLEKQSILSQWNHVESLQSVVSSNEPEIFYGDTLFLEMWLKVWRVVFYSGCISNLIFLEFAYFSHLKGE